MTSKEIDEILKSPITQGAKGRFINIEQLEQIKNKLKESEQKSTPTLSECIKEWKDDGFEFNKIFCYELINKKKNVGIYFDNEPIGICCNIEGHVTSKQLIRLIKTFKALGWEVEDETK